MSTERELAVWFPTVRTGTGTDVSTQRLARALMQRGIRAEITWLPLHVEYAPWMVSMPEPPAWATIVQVNTWLSSRFLPQNTPIVATLRHSMHDPVLRPYKNFTRAAYHRWWIAPNERRVLRRADHVVAVSRFVAETAQRELADVPIEIIYNGIDTSKFRPCKQPRRPGDPFRLLYVGNWKKLKGVDLLAPIMRELGERFELHYTGGTNAERDKPDMPANMRDLGRLSGEEVITAMQNADAFLFPSRSEGLPLVGIEAMACGLPIIAMRASSLVEVVDDGVTGLLCPRDDAAAFAAGARALAESPQLHAAMSRSAIKRVTNKFSVERMVNAYICAYEKCIAPR